MKEIVIIAAAGEQNELGRNGALPWHLPDDFKYFKNQTLGFPIIMGRKTFESFPKPLPGRTHIIITRDPGYKVTHDHCIVVHSIEEALDVIPEAGKVFIIGGGEIYHQALAHATHIALTRVHGTFEADTYFPELDLSCWKLKESVPHPADNTHAYAFSFLNYVKCAKN